MVTNTGRKAADLSQDDEDDEDEDTQRNRYLTFRVGEEDFAIEIAYVTEIIGVQKITEIPDMPDFIKGVINLRGKVIPVMDVRTRFGLPARAYDDRTCVIVVKIGDIDVGLMVDKVHEVIDIPADKTSPPPLLGNGERSRYVRGMGRVGDEVKILLDVQMLLKTDALDRSDRSSEQQAA